jgi:hypothetical protein
MGFAPEVRYRLCDIGHPVEEIGCSEGISLLPVQEAPKRSLEDRIVEALREEGELTAEELYEGAKPARKQAVKIARDKLVAEGIANSKKRESDGREVYFLTSNGNSWG